MYANELQHKHKREHIFGTGPWKQGGMIPGYQKANNTLFFYKNLFYKNVEAEIYQKNMLRTYPRLRVRKCLYFAHLG